MKSIKQINSIDELNKKYIITTDCKKKKNGDPISSLYLDRASNMKENELVKLFGFYSLKNGLQVAAKLNKTIYNTLNISDSDKKIIKDFYISLGGNEDKLF